MEQLWYHAAVWVVGFLAAISRTVRLGNYRSCGHLTSVGACSGFLAYAIVFIPAQYGWNIGIGPAGIGLACLVGLAGQDLHDLLIDKLFKQNIERLIAYVFRSGKE